MNRSIAYIAVALLLSGVNGGRALDEPVQTKPAETPDRQEIKVKTELMEVRAVVTDKNGRIIENLKKEDFELLENDRPQEISFFSVSQIEREPATAEPAMKEKAPQIQTTRARLGEAPVRTTLLYVDNLHLSFSSLNRVKQTLRQFINERLTGQDMVALATSSQTLGIAQQFTRNKEILSYGIDQIRPGPSNLDGFFTPPLAVGVMAERSDAVRLAVDLMRIEYGVHCCRQLRMYAQNRALQVLSEASHSRKIMLSILRDFAEQMVQLPGKRMIIIFSEGFTLHDIDQGTHTEELQSPINRAVRSGVVIYSIDAKGLQAPATIDASKRMSLIDPSTNPSIPREPIEKGLIPPNLSRCPEDDPLNPDPLCFAPDPGQLENFVNLSEREDLNGLYAMAQQTGGKMYDQTNDLGGALGKAMDANRFYYVLSYYLRAGRDDGQFRNIKVRVRNHPEYTVQTPRGFSPSDTIDKAEEPAKTPQQRLLQAMRAPLPVTEIGVSAQADYIETETDDKQVSLTVYFDGDRFQYREEDKRNAFELEILYVVYDSSGKQVEGISAGVQGRLSRERLSQAKTTGYRFARRLALKPGFYELRIGVREVGTDRLGTASTWVEVPELARNNLKMSSLMLRNPLDTDPAVTEGINVSELEQVKIVQGIPLYPRGDYCDYLFRVYPGVQRSGGSDFLLMKELLRGGKPVKQEDWRTISAEEKSVEGKGWFEVEGDVDSGGLDLGVYELRISIKDPQSNKIVQRSAVFGIE